MSYGSIGKTKQETTRLLQDSVALSHNSEAIGMGVGERLRTQREVLQGTKTALGTMQGLSDSASNSIRQIEYRNYKRRCCLWGTMIILFVANVLVLCAMYRNGGYIFAPSAIPAAHGVRDTNTDAAVKSLPEGPQ
jgi:hypothetical protein